MGEYEHLVNDNLENFSVFIAFIFIDFDKNLYMPKFTSKLPKF